MYIHKKKAFNKGLLIGPLAPPYNGQSVAFTILTDKLVKYKTFNCDILNISNRDGILKSLELFLEIIYSVLFKKYDFIYFTSSRTFFGSFRDVLLIQLGSLKKTRIVNHLHGSDFLQFYNVLPSLYKKFIFNCYSKIDTSIVLLENMKEEYKEFPNMKTVVIPNCYGHDLDLLPLKKEIKLDEVRLLYFSNLMKSKGIIDLLDACDSLFYKYKNLTLDIAGSLLGDSYQNKEEFEKEFNDKLSKLQENFPDRIFFHGVCSGLDKINLLWQSDIFVLPTYYTTEAFPISILEAMRAGNFIISTNFRYIPQIVSDKNGVLITPNSISELIEVIEKAVNDKLEMNKVQNFNIQSSIENYAEDRYVETLIKELEIQL